MVIWHKTDDAPRAPDVVKSGDPVVLKIGTYPIEPGQEVLVEWKITQRGGKSKTGKVAAQWQYNDDSMNNSYWVANLGPFKTAGKMQYVISGSNPNGPAEPQTYEFSVSSSAKRRKE